MCPAPSSFSVLHTLPLTYNQGCEGGRRAWLISYSDIMRTTAAFWLGEERQMTTAPQRAHTSASTFSRPLPLGPSTWSSVPPSMTSSPCGRALCDAPSARSQSTGGLGF